MMIDADEPPSRRPRFVVDTMLGKLARWLRAMGYDTLDPREAGDRRLLAVASGEERILLTRDRSLALLAGPRSCLIRSERVDAQIAEVARALVLSPPDTDWLTRCLGCNSPLEPRSREGVRGLVPARVFSAQNDFRGCPGCGKVYWAGSHAGRIVARLTRLLWREPRG